MDTVRLGKTEIITNKNGFGALPIQRITKKEAEKLLCKAYDNGINYFDTARMYSDSEEKVGYALKDVRDKIFIATKTEATTVEKFWSDLETSLRLLQTDYVDVYQFHNPPFCPKPDDASGVYDAMLKAKEKGMIRHIAITNHRLPVAKEAVDSGLYALLQFPFNYLSTQSELDLVDACVQADVGFVSMKALSGGLLQNSAAAYAYQAAYQVLPIWGVQRESELDEFLSYQENPPQMTDDILAIIEKDRDELMADFCRGCAYCMPCPVDIEINNCARMSLLLRRAPSSVYLTEVWQDKMKKIDDCIRCGHCISKCPYGLQTPDLLRDNLKDYQEILAGKSV